MSSVLKQECWESHRIAVDGEKEVEDESGCIVKGFDNSLRINGDGNGEKVY